MPIVKTDSSDQPSGITIHNYNQQSEPLLFSKRLENLLQRQNRKRLLLYFCTGFILSTLLAILAYGLTLGVFELYDVISEENDFLNSTFSTIAFASTTTTTTTLASTDDKSTADITSNNEQKQKFSCKKRIIGFHRLWLSYAMRDSQLAKLTHIIFDKLFAQSNGTILFKDPSEQKSFTETVVRAKKFNVKPIISIGLAEDFEIDTADISGLTDNIFNFMIKHSLAGINIHKVWTLRRSNEEFVKNICENLHRKRQSFKEHNFSISASYFNTETSISLKRISEFIDFFNIEIDSSYYSTYNIYVGPEAPLFSTHPSSGYGNVDKTMKHFSCQSGNTSKLNMLLRFRGVLWKNVIVPNNRTDSLWMTVELVNGEAQTDSIYYKELNSNKLWNISNSSWNDETKTPYVWNAQDRTYLTFENEQSIGEKMKYANDKNIGGVLIEFLDEDDDEDTLLNVVASKEWCSSDTKDVVNYACD